jgi:hypothetical protein
VTLLNVPLAAAAGALLWRSLGWPVVGDAAIFHFIAGQMQMGAIPYRDIIDINMPLIYFVHAAVVATGGMGDVAWRIFDLAVVALMSGLILALLWPAGRAVAIQAALIVLMLHLLLGPYAAGQRDYLMALPALAATLVAAKAAENLQHRWIDLFLVGVFAMIAASLKPSGLLLLALPVIATGRLRWQDAMWEAAGAASAGLLLLGLLARWGRSRLHCHHPGTDAPLCRHGLAPDFRNFPGHDRVAGPDRRTRACRRAEHIRAQAATGASADRTHSVRAHPFARSTQGLVLPCLPLGSN